MPEVGDIVTVVLWRGQYRNDGSEVLDGLRTDLPSGLSDARIEGAPGRWFVVAEAVRYQP